jgi:GTP-binding protein Era
MTHRSGFVSIVGRPNVGKSTLLNYYLGEKVAIVSPIPQTTRHRILGVVTREDAQVILLDSPGLHPPEHALGRHMMEVAKAVMAEADVLLAMIDARRGVTDDDERMFSHIQTIMRASSKGEQGTPRQAVLAINKIDLVKKPRLLPLLEACARRELFAECIPISALTGQQMDVLLDRLIAHLPAGHRWYDPQQRTDQSARQLMSELIREQALLATRQEVPHAIGVLIEEMTEGKRVITIQATVLVERPGQKAILIGRQGTMLKRIGQAARQQIERLLGRKVHLSLWVKVAEHWRRDERVLRELGYVGVPDA